MVFNTLYNWLFGHKTTTYYAERGQLDELKKVNDNNMLWHRDTCVAAAKNGQLECLQYAIKNGYLFVTYNNLHRSCIAAAEEGHIECLRYIGTLNHPFVLDDEITYAAALHGHLDCLIYAHEQQFFIQQYYKYKIPIAAAEGGHLDCLKFLYEQEPYIIDHKTYHAAAKYGHIDCLRFLHEKGVPCVDEMSMDVHYDIAMGFKVMRSKINIFEWIAKRKKCLMYTRDHQYMQNGKCIQCFFTSDAFCVDLIDWNDKRLWYVPAAWKYLRARRKIYMAMERAYIDPKYTWCRRRLLRDFAELSASS